MAVFINILSSCKKQGNEGVQGLADDVKVSPLSCITPGRGEEACTRNEQNEHLLLQRPNILCKTSSQLCSCNSAQPPVEVQLQFSFVTLYAIKY